MSGGAAGVDNDNDMIRGWSRRRGRRICLFVCSLGKRIRGRSLSPQLLRFVSSVTWLIYRFVWFYKTKAEEKKERKGNWAVVGGVRSGVFII